MDILDILKRDITNLNYDRVSKKIYKWILILGYVDYLEESGVEFNKLVNINCFIEYILMYIEEETLSKHLLGTSKGELELIKKREKSYNSFIRGITNKFREMPLNRIMNDSSEYNIFKTDISHTSTSKKLSDKPTKFMIVVGVSNSKEDCINIIRKTCYQRIKEITGFDLSFDNEEVVIIQDGISQTYDELPITAKGRRGQEVYRRKLLDKFERKCALCSITGDYLLTASHAKPWRDCHDTHEKLSEHNGLLLCKNYDALFDQGYITINPVNHDVEFSPYITGDELDLIKSSILPKPDLTYEYKHDKYFLYHYRNIFKS